LDGRCDDEIHPSLLGPCRRNIHRIVGTASDGAMPVDATCFICRKQAGKEVAPPGGYIYEGSNFAICHAPRNMGTAGTLLIESRRHFLDFGEMTSVEGVDLAELLKRLFPAIKRTTQAERVYSIATMDGVPHFHIWLVPWKKDEPLRGVTYLASEHQLSPTEEIEQSVRGIKRAFDRSVGSSRPENLTTRRTQTPSKGEGGSSRSSRNRG
jgi:diadenosine tetraphosphate (Ap4A) HIT family hydrolase